MEAATLGWRGTAVPKPGAYCVVGELSAIVKQRGIQFECREAAVGIDNELDDDRATIFVFQKRSEPGGKLLGQHGKILDAGIDRRAFRGRVQVDGRGFGYEPIDISDSHQHLDAAPGKTLGDFDLIEIARGVVVDGRPEKRAEVAKTGVRMNVGIAKDL